MTESRDRGPLIIWFEAMHSGIYGLSFFRKQQEQYKEKVAVIHRGRCNNNINRDSGIEIPEAWMPTIKKHNNRRTVQQRTTEGTATRRNNGTIGGSK